MIRSLLMNPGKNITLMEINNTSFVALSEVSLPTRQAGIVPAYCLMRTKGYPSGELRKTEPGVELKNQTNGSGISPQSE